MLCLHSAIRHLVHMIEQAQKELQKLRWVVLIYIFVLKLEVNLSLPPKLYRGRCASCCHGHREKDPVKTVIKKCDPALPKQLHSSCLFYSKFCVRFVESSLKLPIVKFHFTTDNLMCSCLCKDIFPDGGLTFYFFIYLRVLCQPCTEICPSGCCPLQPWLHKYFLAILLGIECTWKSATGTADAKEMRK